MGRVLIACEYSGNVRDEFSKISHDAWSCDIIDTESELTKKENKHIIGDVLDVINEKWDMMIAFPPCTYLSSVQTFMCRNDIDRVLKRIEAAKFFMTLVNAPISKICVENPTGVMTHIYRSADQIIHPYFFGGTSFKRTGIWLKNLPVLKHSGEKTLFDEKTHGEIDPPKKTWIQKSTGKIKYQRDVNTPFLTGHERSRISKHIAKAMADQWGKLI